ncbi:MAG: FemAB family PEP-CTERM system-associated protein [Planctomycetia bacterium]|nr:FemAB family PEP-CTERM system-associated protein [Planctomycetia bacterium]
MNISVTLTDQALSQREFEELTGSFSQLHPGFYPQWPVVVQRGMRQKIFILRAMRKDSETASGTLVGVLPLVWMRSVLFGSHLISVPYVNVGGSVIPECPERDEIESVLADEAVRLADSLGVKYLELRNIHEMRHPKLTFERRGKVLMERKLPETASELWKALGPKVRNQVRKGEKSGLRAEWGGKEFLDDFYAVFAETMRNVGTPVYSRKLFEEIFEQFQERVEICLVKTPENSLASAALLIHGRGITEVPSAGTLCWANAACANMFLYWNLLQHSIEVRKSRIFDFGRSTIGSGTWHFKKQWGAEEVPVVWKYYVREGTMDDVRPDNASYGLAIRVWKRLPVWFTKLIGPWIVRGIP